MSHMMGFKEKTTPAPGASVVKKSKVSLSANVNRKSHPLPSFYEPQI